jgi:hypothetical protein
VWLLDACDELAVADEPAPPKPPVDAPLAVEAVDVVAPPVLEPVVVVVVVVATPDDALGDGPLQTHTA